MKLIIALLVFICVASTTIYLSFTKKIELKLTLILLGFSIISGFVIANYDVIKKFKYGDIIEVETAINTIKDSAIKEIKSEIDTQKESIKLLISNANATSDKVKKQKASLNGLIKIAEALNNTIEKQKSDISQLNSDTEKAKKEIEVLNIAAGKIALILVRATYFMIETKHEFGTQRAKKAIDEILKDINIVLPMVIPDTQKRAEWINNLKNTLPEKK